LANVRNASPALADGLFGTSQPGKLEEVTPILIGWDARGRPIELGPEERESTHMHVIGGSGTGKSKFLEWMVRRDAREGHGVCVIDWHGTLYDDILRYFAYQDVGRPGDDRSVILLNPSQPDFISGFNPFVRTGGDLSVQVSRRVDATIRPWGVTDTNDTPTFARLCRVLYTFMVENAETLPNASLLLQFKNAALRAYAAEHVSDPMMRAEWEEFMVNQGTLAPEVRQSAIDTLKTINAYGKAKKVFVTMENRDDGPGRGGREGAATAEGASAPLHPRPRSPSWEVVVEVIKASGIWANPDVGNFPDEKSRAAGLRAMYPLSSGGSHCHYDPERYNEANAIKISKEVGYKGLYSIETAGNNGPDPYAAVQSILDELLRDL
jgi:hypothetical protein